MSRTRLFDRKRLLGAVAASALLAAASQGHALTINATFDSSITSLSNAAAVEAAINNAVSFYSVFTNPATVSIDFQTGGGLGSSNTALYFDSYSDYVFGGLTGNSLSNPQNTVLSTALQPANLAAGNKADIIIATAAGFRALGYDAPGFLGADGLAGDGTFDGVVSLNTAIMDFTNTPNGGLYPANNVIQHEVDEVLGIGGPGTFVSQPFGAHPFGGNLTYMGAEDLYRYGAPGVASFTTDPHAKSYFSYDGGNTDVQDFNQVGGGSDYADWKTSCSGPQNVQDAFGCPGKPQLHLNLGSPEVTALQAIGYDVTVPEPSAWALMIAGFGLAGAALRRRRAAIA
ncbi:MAG TPA: NF038122 family metalloprotease [Phenylobacterium sp.]|nr:NF038122 family metalloprotease [Phenylobacterium sp.]